MYTLNQPLKILISGAGGAPSEGVINSLLNTANRNLEIIGSNCDNYDLLLSNSHKKYYLPHAKAHDYKYALYQLLQTEKPAFAHFQNDYEVLMISSLRDEITKLGVTLFLPNHDTIVNCVNKLNSYEIWNDANIKVPKTILIRNQQDLQNAFHDLQQSSNDKIWIRSLEIGGGGKGALPTNSLSFAWEWINHHDGWGKFSASQHLTDQTVTWLSIWYEGELIVAQTRKRLDWCFGNRTLSGVTGITRIGCTYSDEKVNHTAIQSIKAISKKPHGIFGVDMTYDQDGHPNPTEINIGRFFTTIYFFTMAGLNMPKIYTDLALFEKFPQLETKMNPLPDNLLWIRGMDKFPRLANLETLNQEISQLSQEHLPLPSKFGIVNV